MPIIRIGQDTYSRLRKWTATSGETPNDALLRVLDIAESGSLVIDKQQIKELTCVECEAVIPIGDPIAGCILSLIHISEPTRPY